MSLLHNLNQGVALRHTHYRPSILIAVILSFLLMVQSSSRFFEVDALLSVSPSEPDGAYCIMYSNHLVDCRITFQSEKHTFDLYLLEFGQVTNCSDVKYTYNLENKSVIVPDMDNSHTCVGKLVERNHAKLNISFLPEKDALDLHVNQLHVVLNKC